MNIETKQLQDLTYELVMHIDAADYMQGVKDTLKKYKKQANVPGFRPGMVPDGIIKKMYGGHVLLEEINKTVANALDTKFKEADWHVLGEPMLLPEEEGNAQEWAIGNDFTFRYEVGIAPKVEVDYAALKLEKAVIEVGDDDINAVIDNMRRQRGNYNDEVDTLSDYESMLTGSIHELTEDGNPKEGGLSNEETKLMPAICKDAELQKQFMGVKVGDVLTLDLYKMFPNDWEVSSILGIDREAVEQYKETKFSFQVSKIGQFRLAELNEDFFRTIYGEEMTEEAFREKVREGIQKRYTMFVNDRLENDLYEQVLAQTDMALPLDFLKRWWKSSQKEEVTDEDVEKAFSDASLKASKWEVIASQVEGAENFEIKMEDVIEASKQRAYRQMLSYGGGNEMPGFVDYLASEQLKTEENVRHFAQQARMTKVIAAMIAKTTPTEKTYSPKEFDEVLRAEAEKKAAQNTEA